MERNPIFMIAPNEVAELIAVKRHVLCPNYDICLEEAVIKELHFDCRNCAYMMNDIQDHRIFDSIYRRAS